MILAGAFAATLLAIGFGGASSSASSSIASCWAWPSDPRAGQMFKSVEISYMMTRNMLTWKRVQGCRRGRLVGRASLGASWKRTACEPQVHSQVDHKMERTHQSRRSSPKRRSAAKA